MKLSVSLPSDDVEYLDQQVREGRMPSRSAVLARALQLMRTRSLADDYADAWREWDGSRDAELWDQSAADGIE